MPTRKIDAKDTLIIRELAKDARLSSIELASRVNLKPNAVANRIKRLVRAKIIIGFRPKLNITALGYEHHKVFLTFKNITTKKSKEIAAYLQYHPNVIYITKAFGISDLEFEVIVKGKN